MPSLQYDPTTIEANPAFTPADAQGANFTPAVGQALEGLGQQASRLTGDVARINYQRKQADDITALKQNMMQGDEQFTDLMEHNKSQVAVNGAGYVDKFKEAFDPWAQQLIDQQTDPRVKRIAAEQVAAMHNKFYNQASAWQVNTNRAWRVNTFDNSITNDAADVQADPTQYQSKLKGQLDTIDALSGELHPEDKIALAQKAQKALAEGASLGFVQAMPQKAQSILQSEQPLPPDSIQGQIVAEAKAKGVDPNVALANAQLESGMKPDAKNPTPGATAQGLFGQIDSSFAQYGGTDRGDVVGSIKAGVAQMADSQKALKQSLGRDPTPYDQRIAHWFGIGAAPAIINAPDNAPFGALLQKMGYKDPAATLTANGLNAQTTAGDVKHLVQVNMDKAMAQTAGAANAPEPGSDADATKGMPDFFRQLTPQGREAMLTHATTLNRKDQTVERTQVESQFNDAAAAWERGEGAKDAPNLAQWQSAYGPQMGLMKYQKQVQLQAFGSQYAKVATASPEQQEAIYAQSAGSNTAEGMQLHDAMGQAINKANAERAADPVGFDQTKGMKLTQPLDFSDPTKLTSGMAARFESAAQISQTFRTPYQPLSRQESLQLGAMVSQGSPQQVQDTLASLRVAAGANPERYMAALGQIAPNQPIVAHAGAIADQNPQAAALMIQGDRLLHPNGKEKEATILMPPDGGAAGFKQAWQQSGAPEAYAGNQKSEDLAFQAAKAYYVAAQSPKDRSDKQISSDLWGQAIKASTGGVVSFGTGKTIPPYGMPPEKFPDAVASVWPQVMKDNGLDATQHPAQGYSLVAIGPGQYGVTSGTGSLRGSNGQPVVFDLTGNSAAATQPTPPTAIPKKPLPLETDTLHKFGSVGTR